MTDRWSAPSVLVHWLATALLVGVAAGGFVMTGLADDAASRLVLSRLHSLAGVLLVALTAARLVIRRRRATPEPLPLGELHRKGVGVVHGLIYGVTFALGASGALTGALSAWPSYLRGEMSRAPALAQLAPRQAHEALVFVLLGLVALHVGGVLLQQLRRGAVLRRMVPFLQ